MWSSILQDIKPLLQMLKDEDEDVRAASVNVIKALVKEFLVSCPCISPVELQDKIGKTAIVDIFSMLKDDDSDVRTAGMNVLDVLVKHRM